MQIIGDAEYFWCCLDRLYIHTYIPVTDADLALKKVISTLWAEIINDPAQKILPGQDLPLEDPFGITI